MREQTFTRLARKHSIQTEVRDMSVPGGSIQVLRFSIDEHRGQAAGIVFVPGWASTPYTWRYFLPPLVATTPVSYVETREKSSSRLTNPRQQSVTDQVDDIRRAIEASAIERPVIVGASTGANLVLELLLTAPNCCQAFALLAPHLDVPVPSWLSLFARLPDPMTAPMKKLAVLTLKLHRPRRFEEDQYEGLVAAASSAQLRKLGASAAAWAGHQVRLPALNREISGVVVGSASDSFHNRDGAQEIARRMAPTTSYFEVANFTALHASSTATLIAREFLGLAA